MSQFEQCDNISQQPAGVNPGYAAFQIAKALKTSEYHRDPAARARAKEKINKWETVLNNILNGSIGYGSRTPIQGVPAWATPEVITGGFATGNLLARGALQEHERILLDSLQQTSKGDERLILNTYFLTDSGLQKLQRFLHSGCYDVIVPEEGALLTVAWLTENGQVEKARQIIGEIAPYFPSLRFFPVPLTQPRRFGTRVHVQSIASTIKSLEQIKPKAQILAQKEAVMVWNPYYDRIIALFLETVENDWPCRHYPTDWQDRARKILDEYAQLRMLHRICKKPDHEGGYFAQIRTFLKICSQSPQSLTGREVGRIRLILKRYVAKHGSPSSATLIESRQKEVQGVSKPTFREIAEVVITRLQKHSDSDGVDDAGLPNQPINADESAVFKIPDGTPVPDAVQRKVERCMNETIQVLVERGLITSGEALAKVLPQMTSGIRAAGITDPALRQLYIAVYQAFRRRRSLLLLNLEKQVQIEELPWVAAIDQFRSENLSNRELARQTLEEVVLLTIASFPYAILPNRLLQELRALIKTAGLDIPLVDEVAADIFMGQFTGKYLKSAKAAADLLQGTLYATYYDIDYEKVLKISEPSKNRFLSIVQEKIQGGFIEMCASRAGVGLGSWRASTNGMIIEQQQILTTQNLAALFAELDLLELMPVPLSQLARQCFGWVSNRHQMKINSYHANLVMIKNTAYAWRNLVFFLALLPEVDVVDFLRWAEDYLNVQSLQFQERFRPVLKGLILAARGQTLESESARKAGARRFLGWSDTRHWMLLNFKDE